MDVACSTPIFESCSFHSMKSSILFAQDFFCMYSFNGASGFVIVISDTMDI